VTQGFSQLSMRRRSRLALLLLLLPAMVLRSLIPVGFMPAREAPFSVEICPEGFPTQLLSHAGHRHGHGGEGGPARSDHCAFGSAWSSGPLAESAACGASAATPQVSSPSTARHVLFVRLVHLPEARGPPPA
jgi:hypothetical protein